MSQYLIQTSDLLRENLPSVGVKNYGLKLLRDLGMHIPTGFALTTRAFEDFVDYNSLSELVDQFSQGDATGKSEELQDAVKNSQFPADLERTLRGVCHSLVGLKLVVRSSCNYEDTDFATFAGQYKTVLNVSNEEELLDAVKECYASIYSATVLSYLSDNGINPRDIKMSLVIQEMIDANQGASGVILTTDPFSGSSNITYIEACYGFGEGLVSGYVEPDSFRVRKDNNAIVQNSLGKKKNRVDYEGMQTIHREVVTSGFSLTDEEVKQLNRKAKVIVDSIGHPIDLEFIIKRGEEPIFVQIRPQIIKDNDYLEVKVPVRTESDLVITRGTPVVPESTQGQIRFFNPHDQISYGPQDIVYVDKLDITYIPRLKYSAGLIIPSLGLGSHPALIVRELGLPTITNLSDNPRSKIYEGQKVTLDSNGEIVEGYLDLKSRKLDFASIPKVVTPVIVASTSPHAFQPYRRVHVNGILMRGGEFTIVSDIGIHPQAIIDYDEGKLDGKIVEQIGNIVDGYSSAKEFFISKLSQGIAAVGTLVSPLTPLLYRFCDFPSSDYTRLIGGERYEPQEENPMLGLRGVTRMLQPSSREALELEATAVKRVKEEMGFSNLEVLVAFCRTPEDGVEIKRRLDELKVPVNRFGMMIEIPSNYLCADHFADTFDFFLFGPADLTQTALAADRNNTSLAKYHNPAGEVPKRAVETLLKRIEGMERDVMIGSYELFQHYPNYHRLKSNNNIIFAELADSLVSSITKLAELERSMGLQ